MLQVTAPPSETASTKISREPSPFTGQRLADLAALSFLEESLTRRQSDAEEDEAENYGQLLASAIYNGALLNRKIWNAWLAALHDGVRFKHETLWIELTLRESEAPEIAPENRRTRWFADPITQMLILRWRSCDCSNSAKDRPEATVCLNAFLRSCGQSGVEQSDLSQSFLASAELRWRLRMPGLLVDYARGAGPSISVNSARWSRLVNGCPVYVAKPVLARKGDPGDSARHDEETPPPEEFSKYPHISLDDTKSCLDVALSILAEFPNFVAYNSRSKCRKKLIDLSVSRSIPINESRILDYAISRVKRDASCTHNLREVSPKYIISIVKYLKTNLLPWAGDADDLADIPSDDLYEIYKEILYDDDDIVDKYGLNIIDGFHSFIETINPSAAILFDNERSTMTPSNVDANLISSRNYYDALSSLRGNTHGNRVCRLLTILGYRTGLRYSEARGIRLCDLRFEGEFAELVVRENVHRPLKTPSAHRTLPLDVLLTPAELEELRNWVEYKQENRGRPSDLLFSTFRQPTTLPSKRVGARINEILRRVTGDEFARYHHLRHSFASYLLASFLLPRDLRALPRIDGFDEDTVSHRRRQLISDRLLGHGKLGRGAAHCVSTLCGHAQVETTLHSYGHLLDWLVGLYASRPDAQPNLSLTAGRNLTGQSSTEAVVVALRRARDKATTPPDHDRSQSQYRASPALRSLDATGQFKKGPLKPGSNYHLVLLKAAKRKWGIPPPRLERGTVALLARPSRTSKKRRRPIGRYIADDHVREIGGIADIERLRTDPAAARAYLTSVRWREQVTCPSCESAKTYEIGRMAPLRKPGDRELWKCGVCESRFSAITGTPLHRSRASLGDWILAIYTICLCSSTAGVRRSDLARRLGANHQLAGFMYRRIWHAILQTPLRGFLDKSAHADALAAPGGALPTLGRRTTAKEPNSTAKDPTPEKAHPLPKSIKFRADTATALSLEDALAFLLRAAPRVQ